MKEFMDKVIAKFKEAIKNKWVLIGGIAALVIVVVLVVVLCISCGAKDDTGSANNENDNKTTGDKVASEEDSSSEDSSIEEKDTTETESSTEESSSSDEEQESQEGSNGSGNGANGSGGTGTGTGTGTGNGSGGTGGGLAATDFGMAVASGTLTKVGNRVSVHDPSIEYDPVTKKWYIFGSHTDFASTSNLINWTTFEGGSSSKSKYGTIFAQSGQWAALGSSSYDISGNLWAPDVIYNHDMGKWCMYMSVNGNNYYSSIAMATADSITGPYTYQGTVVYSGFSNSTEAAKTDYSKVTGTNNVDSRYLVGGNWNPAYGTNAIDPCVLYDKNGQLWMVYGSWFGGLFMLKLDNSTGLRDYSYTYALDTNASDGRASDPYLGQRVSGGFGGTGEGPYIVWDKAAGYYYMYVSYCGLNATDDFAGYQMRLFRSKNIDGPYVDAAGNNALRTSSGDSQVGKGIKIMGNYRFSSLSSAESGTGSQSGYKSPGHNSAIVDNNGNRYLIYHTRFNGGTEWHQVRVHQQFLNEDGWLVTAPYEYLGSSISSTGYNESEIVGSYELVNHGNDTSMSPGMLSTYLINLNADHTITGDFTGTWSQKSGSYYATIVIDGVTYKGVFFKQFDESSSHTDTMTFSVIGSNNIALWGSRTGSVAASQTGNQVASYAFEDSSNLGKDYVGVVGTATINGCTAYNDATRGAVLAFDGQDDYVQLASAATKYGNYTIMMWIKPSSTNTWARVFDLGNDSSSSMFYTVSSELAAGRFAQQINSDGEKRIEASSTPTNTWTHIALTVNGSTRNATLYVNGTRIGSVALSALPSAYSGAANYLGKSQYPDPYFHGYMDNVFIFDYALSADKVKEYMNK